MTLKEIAERMEADAFLKNCDISVLVEDWKDEIFWQAVIKKQFPHYKIDFPYSEAKGSDAVLKYKDFVNKKLIICIDSDNKYLYTENHDLFKNYIFHTYVYNIENFQCNPNSLKQICKEIVLLDNFDFQNFLKKLSETISPILYFWLYIYETSYKEGKEILSVKKIRKVLKLKSEEIDITNIEETFIKLKENIEILLNELKTTMDWYDSAVEYNIPDIKEKLSKQNILIDEIYLFFNGHIIFENIITPLLNSVITKLKQDKISEIKETLKNAKGKVLEENLKQFENITNKDVATKLSDNFNYAINNLENNEWMTKIFNDFRRLKD